MFAVGAMSYATARVHSSRALNPGATIAQTAVIRHSTPAKSERKRRIPTDRHQTNPDLPKVSLFPIKQYFSLAGPSFVDADLTHADADVEFGFLLEF